MADASLLKKIVRKKDLPSLPQVVTQIGLRIREAHETIKEEVG